MLFILLLILLALLIWPVVIYNLLIRDRNRVAQSWSDVDVQLLRRHELIPRLVEMVKGYAGYERALPLTSRDAVHPAADPSCPADLAGGDLQPADPRPQSRAAVDRVSQPAGRRVGRGTR